MEFPLKWNDDYRTGFEEIDEQHKLLFQMSDDYQIALNAGEGEASYGLLLTAMQLYIRVHFAAEEKCMFRHKCPAGPANKAAHLMFTSNFKDKRAAFDRDGFSEADARATMTFLDKWLAEHIAQIDTKLRPYAEFQ